MNSSSPKSRQRIGGRSGSQDGVLGRSVLTILHGHRLGDRPPGDPLPAMAVLGRSNVGKSSLLNALLKTDVARVSQTPGRTQALYWYRVDGAFDVVDCPGYGYAKTAKEKREAFSGMIEAFLTGEPIPALALLLVDGRLEPQESDRSMALFLQESGIRTVVAATKWDAVQPSKRVRQRRTLAAEYETLERPLQPVSSETGEHLNDLARLLRARLISNPPIPPTENRTEES
ncbi:MAG: ribosome biogenesis GTP-binding protein YihA/YsxC [Thermoanaerobaculia bacterium]